MDINHISVSRKSTFDDCQQKYKFRYHLKMIPEGPTPVHFSYGKTVHKVAEEYIRAGGARAIEEIGRDVINGLIPIEENTFAPPLTGDYIQKFPEHLRVIKNLTEKIGFDGHLEWPFEYDLDPPNGRKVVGFIDRLIIRGEKYFILDYKTTKKGMWRKNSNTIKKDLQLRCYGKIVQNHFGAEAENIQAALYYLEGAELVSTKFTQESLDTAAEELLNSYKMIENMNPDDAWGRVTPNCRFCDYRKQCAFYSLT